MDSVPTRPRSESTSSVSAQLGLSLLSLSDIASKQQQIPVPPTSPGLPPPGSTPAATKETKHRRLGSIGQSRRRLSDARDAAVRPSIAQLATSPPTQQSIPTPAKPLGILSKSVPMDSAFPASMTQAYASQSAAAEETSASTPTGRGKSVGASSVVADGTANGQATTTSGPKKKGTIFRCESCSKVYRHPSCLVKHRWEHSPQWREASKFLLSKHQQVQLLEAAAILSHLSPGTSLPEDRSLWPSYLSGGLLPTPEPIAIPNTRSAGVGALAALGGSSSSSSAFATRQHATIDSNGWGADSGRHQGTASSLPSSSPPFAPLGLTGRTRGRSMSSQSGPVLESRSKARQSQSVSTRSVADSISELGENDDLEMEMEMGVADDEVEVKTEEEVETRLGRGMRTRAWSGRMAGKTMTPTRKDTVVPISKAKLRRDDRGMSIDKDQEGESDNEDTSESDVEELRNPYLQGSYPLASPHVNSVAVPGLGVAVGNASGHVPSHALPIPGRTSQDAWNVTRDHGGSYSSSFSPSPHSHQGSLAAHANYQFSHSDSPPLSSSLHSHYAHYVHSDSRSAKLHYDPSSSLSLSSYEPSLSTSLSSSVGLPRSSVRGGLEDDDDEAEKFHDEDYSMARRHGVHHVHTDDNGDSWSAMELEMDF